MVALPLLAAPAFAAAKPKAVASFSLLGDLLAEVGGEDVEITTLVGPEADVHSFQPTPREVRMLAAASLLVSIGLGFESWLDRLAAAATDPTRADRYRARAAAYNRKLAALDDWVRSEIAKVPENKRRAIVGHRSFDSFGHAYGVELLAISHGSHDHEPSAHDLAELIRLARQQNIKAVFVEHLANPALPAEIARDVGVKLGPPLYGDALSDRNGPAPSYEAMMRYNVTTLVAGMLKN